MTFMFPTSLTGATFDWLCLPRDQLPALAEEYIHMLDTAETKEVCACEWVVHPDDVDKPEGKRRIRASGLPSIDCWVHTAEGKILGFFTWLFKVRTLPTQEHDQQQEEVNLITSTTALTFEEFKEKWEELNEIKPARYLESLKAKTILGPEQTGTVHDKRQEVESPLPEWDGEGMSVFPTLDAPNDPTCGACGKVHVPAYRFSCNE